VTDEQLFDLVFGPESTGATVEERRATGQRLWVRSSDHLAVYAKGATGLLLTPEDALEIFGAEVLEDAVDKGSAVIVCDPEEPARSIRVVRERLGMTQQYLADRASVTLESAQKAEDCKCRSSIHDLVKICGVLGIDPKRISFHPFS